MQSIFTGSYVGNYSLGSSASRYFSTTLSLSSGEVIPTGAQITSVTFNCSNITVWSNNVVSGAYMRLDGTSFATAQWTPTGDNQNLTKDCYTTASLYTGKSSMIFWTGWDSTPTSSWWCSYRSGGSLTLTVNWNAKSSATLSSSSVAAGNSVSVSISRASSSYTHTVTYSFGSYSQSHTSVATSDSYTIPLSWCNAIPSSTSGTGYVTVETFSGTSSLGSTTLSLTITVPSSVVPTAGILDLNATGMLADTYYVQGRTSISPAVSGSAGVYGSTIVGYAYSYSGLLQTNGNLTVTATVTDSRSRTAQVSTTIYVYAYNSPGLECTVYRSDSSGTKDDSGTYIYALATATGTNIPSSGTNVNTMTLTVQTKLSTDTTWGTATTMTSGTSVLLSTYSATSAYDVKIIASEAAGGTNTCVIQIPTAGYLMYVKKDGTGAAFGKACEHTNALEIPSDWDFYKGSSSLASLIQAQVVNAVYPVGSIYMSVNSTSPATLFGGSWTQLQDTFLLAAGANYAAGDTGGEATHTLTTNEMPSHNHGSKSTSGSFSFHNAAQGGLVYGVSGVFANSPTAQSNYYYTTATMTRQSGASSISSVGFDYTHTHNSNGGGAAHNNMPPYLAVYMWKRTA